METVNKKNLKLLNQINSFGFGVGGGGGICGIGGVGRGCSSNGDELSKRSGVIENFSMSNLESRLKLAKSLNSMSGCGISYAGGGSGVGSSSCSKLACKKIVQNYERESSAAIISRINNQSNNNNSHLSNQLVSRLSDQTPSVVLTTNIQVYDRQALLKRFTEDFYTLDKDMHFEFCVRFIIFT